MLKKRNFLNYNIVSRIAISIFLLLLGTIIYYFFNNYEYSTSLKIIRNYLPDMCWTISFFFASIIFSKNITKYPIILSSLFVLILSLTYETLQLFNLVDGTFDIYDIYAYNISIIISIIYEIRLRRNENEKNM